MSQNGDYKTSTAPKEKLLYRLLKLSWRYRKSCVKILIIQISLLSMGLLGLGLTGIGIDFVNSRVNPSGKPPHWPLGLVPPESWSAIKVLGIISGIILAQALLRTLLNYLNAISVARLIHQEIVANLRGEIYDKLQRLSFRFFDANATGSIINRVTGDVQDIRAFVDGVLIQGTIMVLSLGVYLFYMLSIHVHLTLACLATTPLLWFSSSIFSRRVRPEYKKNRELSDKMLLTLTESIQGILVTKSFGREREEIQKFNTANRLVRDQQQRAFWEVSMFQPFIGFLTHINLIVLLSYGGYLTIYGDLPLGTGFFVFAGLLQQFSGQVANISTITNNAQQSLNAAQRVFEILDDPIEIKSPTNATRLSKAKGSIKFEKVWFEYRSEESVLEEINFEIEPGKCVALLGATGSGKSTLLSLIPRFYDPARGRILIDDLDIRHLDLEDLRRNIGLVFQESFLFTNTIRANIAFGYPNATHEQVEKAARIAAAHDFITKLPQGYDTVMGERGVDFSGGQRQRLAIARAILLEPSILLLDDPTAAIDPHTESEILEAMENAIEGRTTFLVAHRLSTLRRADIILVLDNGRIVQSGTHDQLVRLRGPYRRVARAQGLSEESLGTLDISGENI
jgi:ATP-binding cassette subfamily B protein